MSGIVVGPGEGPVIELAPVVVRFDFTVEDMIAGLPMNHPDITEEHFPNCRGGRTGRETARLFLARAVPGGEWLSTQEVLTRLDEAGLVPEDLPQLAALREHCDPLWGAPGVYYVIALGANSIWRQPGRDWVVHLDLRPWDRGFRLNWLGHAWDANVGFLARRA